MIGVWVLTAIQPSDSVGIKVHAIPVGARDGYFDRWTQALVVRVDSRHKYYLNSNPVPGNRITPALAVAFKTRANWTVYIQGDPDASYGDVVQAADAVRAAQGTIVLLTAKSR
jgi:biopolymer transport protein ExbD